MLRLAPPSRRLPPPTPFAKKLAAAAGIYWLIASLAGALAGLSFGACVILAAVGAGLGAAMILWRRATADGLDGSAGARLHHAAATACLFGIGAPLALIPLAVFVGLGLYALIGLPLSLFRG